MLIKNGNFDKRKLSNNNPNIKNSNNLNVNFENINNLHYNNSDKEDYLNENLYDKKFKKEKLIFRPMAIFSEIFNSSSVQTLLAIGNRPAPLSLVGYYLDCLGNFLVDLINSKYHKNIFINKAEVKQIKIFNNQEFGILVSRVNSNVNHTNSDINQATILNENLSNLNNNNIIIKAKNLVLATGGKQDTLNPYYIKICETKGAENVFRSDYFLREEGYEKLFKVMLHSYINFLKNNPTNNNLELIKKKKIVIIGGSHSGFSSAWILLNEPSTYKYIKKGQDYKQKYNPNCIDCIKYILKYKYLLKKLLEISKSDKKILDDGKVSISDEAIKLNGFLNIKFNEDYKQNEFVDSKIKDYENLEENLFEKDFVEKEITRENYQQEINKLIPCNCLGAIESHIWTLDSLNQIDTTGINLLYDYISKQPHMADSSNNYDRNTNTLDKLIKLNEDNLKHDKHLHINNNCNEISDADRESQKNKTIKTIVSYIKNNLIEIQILYRDHIRVFYPSEKEAFEDNYSEYDKKEAFNKQGKIYPFIGIRGDAKELYKTIITGEEKRIHLIKTSTNEEQRRLIQEADYVIWACGYNTNNIKISDSKNHPLEFYVEDTGMIEVSKQLNILKNTKEPIKNLFGIGQGYSTKAPELINGKKARADSIHLYNTHISQRLYNALQGLFSKNNIDLQHKNANNFNINSNGSLANAFANNFFLNKNKKKDMLTQAANNTQNNNDQIYIPNNSNNLNSAQDLNSDESGNANKPNNTNVNATNPPTLSNNNFTVSLKTKNVNSIVNNNAKFKIKDIKNIEINLHNSTLPKNNKREKSTNNMNNNDVASNIITNTSINNNKNENKVITIHTKKLGSQKNLIINNNNISNNIVNNATLHIKMKKSYQINKNQEIIKNFTEMKSNFANDKQNSYDKTTLANKSGKKQLPTGNIDLFAIENIPNNNMNINKKRSSISNNSNNLIYPRQKSLHNPQSIQINNLKNIRIEHLKKENNFKNKDKSEESELLNIRKSLSVMKDFQNKENSQNIIDEIKEIPIFDLENKTIQGLEEKKPFSSSSYSSEKKPNSTNNLNLPGFSCLKNMNKNGNNYTNNFS